MKNTTNTAAKFFADYFGVSIYEAKQLNHMTLDCMVKYVEQIRSYHFERFKEEIKGYADHPQNAALEANLKEYQGEEVESVLMISEAIEALENTK